MNCWHFCERRKRPSQPPPAGAFCCCRRRVTARLHRPSLPLPCPPGRKTNKADEVIMLAIDPNPDMPIPSAFDVSPPGALPLGPGRRGRRGRGVH